MSDNRLALPRHLIRGAEPRAAIWKKILLMIHDTSELEEQPKWPSQVAINSGRAVRLQSRVFTARGHGTLCTCWLPVEVDDLARLVTSTPFDPAAIVVATIRRRSTRLPLGGSDDKGTKALPRVLQKKNSKIITKIQIEEGSSIWLKSASRANYLSCTIFAIRVETITLWPRLLYILFFIFFIWIRMYAIFIIVILYHYYIIYILYI